MRWLCAFFVHVCTCIRVSVCVRVACVRVACNGFIRCQILSVGIWNLLNLSTIYSTWVLISLNLSTLISTWVCWVPLSWEVKLKLLIVHLHQYHYKTCTVIIITRDWINLTQINWLHYLWGLRADISFLFCACMCACMHVHVYKKIILQVTNLELCACN